MWLVEDFRNGESLLVFKMHHVIADGLGMLILLACLQENYSPSQWVAARSVMNCCTRFLIFCAKPFLLTYAFLFFFFWSTDKNCIKGKVCLKGYKQNAVCKEFKTATLRQIGRHFNGTINDVVLSITSQSLKQYFEKHG